MNALTAANNIKQQAQNAWDEVQQRHGQFQNYRQSANNEFNQITRRVQRLLNDINYTMGIMTRYKNNIEANVTLLGHVNQQVFNAKDTANKIHNQVTRLNQFIQNIRQAAANANIQIPF